MYISKVGVSWEGFSDGCDVFYRGFSWSFRVVGFRAFVFIFSGFREFVYCSGEGLVRLVEVYLWFLFFCR